MLSLSMYQEAARENYFEVFVLFYTVNVLHRETTSKKLYFIENFVKIR
jgi:hypothetical protein